MSFLTMCIFCMGVVTVFLSAVVALRFWGFKKGLSPQPHRLCVSISFQLIGEAVIGLGTLIFAAAAHFSWLEHWSIELQSAIRFAMFFATSATTIHLFRTLHRIKKHGPS